MKVEEFENNDDFFNEKLRASFHSWTPEMKQEDFWNKLSDSLDFEEEVTKKATDFQNIGVLVPPLIWDRINLSLEMENTDHTLRQSFDDWQPTPKTATWEKLDDSIRIEKTWEGIKVALSNIQPKYLSFSRQLILILFGLVLTFKTRDQGVTFKLQLNKAEKSSTTTLASAKISFAGNKANVSTFSFKRGALANKRPVINIEDNSKKSTDLLLENELEQAIKPLNRLTCSLFNEQEKEPIPIKLYQIKLSSKKTQFGINFYNSLSIINEKKQDRLNTNKESLGYEFGLFIGHPLRKLYQEYNLNYSVFRQTEKGYKNGNYSSSSLIVSGLKFHTVTKVITATNFNYGAGLSLFFPFQSVKERENVIVELPKTNFINLGCNVSLDYANFLPIRKLILGIKYELLFPLNHLKSSHKNYQSLSVGLKYQF